ncbi:hypothetical protein Bbelb_394970, partial [Branchiostoma belcheri]
MSADLTNGHAGEPSAGQDAPLSERERLDQAAQDWVAGVKEREELRKQIQEKDSELQAAQKKVYELMKKVESLEGRLELRELNIRAQALMEIAEKFPNMKLSTILDAEKKFVAADEDGNGV